MFIWGLVLWVSLLRFVEHCSTPLLTVDLVQDSRLYLFSEHSFYLKGWDFSI